VVIGFGIAGQTRECQGHWCALGFDNAPNSPHFPVGLKLSFLIQKVRGWNNISVLSLGIEEKTIMW
jgi:hypothetical protein